MWRKNHSWKSSWRQRCPARPGSDPVSRAVILAVLAAGLSACSTTSMPAASTARYDTPSFSAPGHYSYFHAPVRGDPWSRKIRAWQRREAKSRAGQPVSARPLPAAAERSPIGSGLLAEFQRFRSERRRELVRELSTWVQGLTRRHYVADGVFDHWATLESTFARDGEDCDGLELLSYYLLRELDFAEERVYRAVIYRPADGLHHMVTLWFEDGSDPWVIDPTGAMTKIMARMSDHTDWVPIKVFSATEEFSVLPRPAGGEFARNQVRRR